MSVSATSTCTFVAPSPPRTTGSARSADVESEAVDPALHRVERHTGIDECAEQHVAARTCRAVDPTDRHESEPPNNESIRTAAHAAPNPLSMFTTVTPWAQLASALCSAAVPPVATP